jgi:RNA polymerase sigma factor (sigma-70 family)
VTDDSRSSHVRTDFGELSDAELVRATRDGSRRAYAALWARHAPGATSYARTLSVSDADDVVSEAFMKVYIAIKAGGGPEDDFRYYLRSSVRNTYVSMVRARRTAPAGDAIEEVIGDDGAEAATVTRFDGSVTARAFLSLPTRWQEVLWYTEVEGLSREHTASLLGMNANAVSALAFRAREALRTAWLQQHVSAQQGLDKDCEAVTPLLGAHSRQTLPRRDRVRVEQHLSGCGRCTSVVDELADLLTPGRLAMVLLPVLAGGVTAAAFASKIAAGSAVMTSASASTIGSPAATVVATVGGSTAASGGAAAMAVVGKVAACALVAGVVIAPAPILIAASAAEHSHTLSAHDAGHHSHPPSSDASAALPEDPDDDPTSAYESGDGASADGDGTRGAPADPGSQSSSAPRGPDENSTTSQGRGPSADKGGQSGANGVASGVAKGQSNGAANGQGNGVAKGQADSVSNGPADGGAKGQTSGATNGESTGKGPAPANAETTGSANAQTSPPVTGQASAPVGESATAPVGGQAGASASGEPSAPVSSPAEAPVAAQATAPVTQTSAEVGTESASSGTSGTAVTTPEPTAPAP